VTWLGSTTSYGLEVARGNRPGVTAERKFGRSAAVGTSNTVISGVGGAAPYMPTTAVTVEAISASANDTAAGTGARTIVIAGLDANFAYATATITMAGTGATSATAGTFSRVYRAYVDTAGTYGGNNAGAITVRASGAGTSFLTIDAGMGQSQTTHYCVPAGRTAYVTDVHLTLDSTKAMDITFWRRNNGDDVSAPYAATRVVQEFDGLVAPIDFEYTLPLKFDAKTDLWFTGKVSVGTGKASVEWVYVEDTA
jgi:hypothetical protein